MAVVTILLGDRTDSGSSVREIHSGPLATLGRV
jgi:hypothetical protein